MSFSIGTILFLAGLGFSLAAPIGPVNMEMLKQTLKSTSGWIMGLFTGIGAMSGDFIISMTVLFVGTTKLRELLNIKIIYLILVLANISILVYIAISALKSNPKVDSDSEIESSANLEGKLVFKIGRQYTTGLAIVITSPWSYFWWLSFGPYIIQSGVPIQTLSDRLIITLYFLLGIFVWVCLFVGLLALGNRFASPLFLKRVTQASALIILLFAFKILFDASCFLLSWGLCG